MASTSGPSVDTSGQSVVGFRAASSLYRPNFSAVSGGYGRFDCTGRPCSEMTTSTRYAVQSPRKGQTRSTPGVAVAFGGRETSSRTEKTRGSLSRAEKTRAACRDRRNRRGFRDVRIGRRPVSTSGEPSTGLDTNDHTSYHQPPVTAREHSDSPCIALSEHMLDWWLGRSSENKIAHAIDIRTCTTIDSDCIATLRPSSCRRPRAVPCTGSGSLLPRCWRRNSPRSG